MDRLFPYAPIEAGDDVWAFAYDLRDLTETYTSAGETGNVDEFLERTETTSLIVARTYRGDRRAFERVQAYFADASRFTEEAWEQVRDDEHEAVFRKGAEVAHTFGYRSPTLEVRSVIGYDADAETITVTVGNRGFPGEVHLARARYLTLLDKIGAYITANGIAVEASTRVRSQHRATPQVR